MRKEEDPSCKNCRYEYDCDWDPEMICGTWKPDADKKGMEVRENERQQVR